MKKIFFISVLFLVSCGAQQTVTPVISSPPATQILNQYPTPLPTPTLAMITKSIEGDEMEKAFNFLYELKNLAALGEYEHFAEEIRYPITAMVDGQAKTFIFAADFEANFEKIFSKGAIQEFISIDESRLTFSPDGVKVGDGIIWFDLICMDPTCDEAEFLITEINN